MKLGALLTSAIPARHADLPAEVDRFTATNGKPDVVPIIVRDRVFPTATVAALRERCVEPWIYLTSHGWTYAFTPTEVRSFAEGKRDLVVRFDQEPNGKWDAPWATIPASRYRLIFQEVSHFIRSAAPGAQLTVSLIWTGADQFARDLDTYYVGDAAQRFGLDIYARSRAAGLAANIERAIPMIREAYPGIPIDITEAGIHRELRRRGRGLRDALRVAAEVGVETFVYTDQDPPEEAAMVDENGDPRMAWTMSRQMRKVWREA